MKQSEFNDEKLNKVLREWKAKSALPPRFQDSVWHRIARAEAQSQPSVWRVVVEWVKATMNRPVLAASFALVLLAIGATAGWSQARQETARVSGELSERYAHLVDPYKPTR